MTAMKRSGERALGKKFRELASSMILQVERRALSVIGTIKHFEKDLPLKSFTVAAMWRNRD